MGFVHLTRWQKVLRWWFRHEDRILITWILACLTIIILSGCANFQTDLAEHEARHCMGEVHSGEAPFYVWSQAHPPSIKPWLYVYALDVDLACRTLGLQPQAGHRINACAQWRPANCLIILPEGLNP